MTFGHSVVQRSVAGAVRGVQRAPVLEQQGHHGHGAHGSGAVDGVLATLVPDSRGYRRGMA